LIYKTLGFRAETKGIWFCKTVISQLTVVTVTELTANDSNAFQVKDNTWSFIIFNLNFVLPSPSRERGWG
jgi:hypothetical protein